MLLYHYDILEAGVDAFVEVTIFNANAINGCCSSTGAVRSNSAGAGTGKIWLDDLQCTGREMSLYGCPSVAMGEHNCGHSEDVSVNCSCNIPQSREYLYIHEN